MEIDQHIKGDLHGERHKYLKNSSMLTGPGDAERGLTLDLGLSLMKSLTLDHGLATSNCKSGEETGEVAD